MTTPCTNCPIPRTCKRSHTNPTYCISKPSPLFAKYYRPTVEEPSIAKDLSGMAKREHFIRMSVCGNGD